MKADWSSSAAVGASAAATKVSRLRRPSSGSEYLLAMISPCSVSRYPASALPFGCARIARAIDTFGHEGAAELAKLEALLVWLRDHADTPGAARTLAGALVRVKARTVCVRPAPARRATLCSP